MATVQRRPSGVNRNDAAERTALARVLEARPYLHRKYYDLAAFLCSREYTTPMRDKIIDWLTDGGTTLDCLVADGTIEAEDLDGAKEALEAGRAWWARYSGRAVPKDAAIVPPELEGYNHYDSNYANNLDRDDDEPGDDGWIDPTADADGDPVHADDRDEPAEYIPSDADLADYARWLAEQERAQADDSSPGGRESDGMAFPEAEYSLEDRRRWDRQNRLADDWYRTFVAD